MSDYVIPGGAFEQAFEALAETGWELKLESAVRPGTIKAPPSKLKYTCPACVLNAWAKPSSRMACIDCLLGNLDKLPWIDGRKMNDLVGMVGRSEMLLPKDDLQPDTAASYEEEILEAAE